MKESREEKCSNEGTHIKHGGLLRDILEGEMGKKRGIPRLEYFSKIIKDRR